MHIVGVIPARYASTRFPGKPLALIAGTTMIERVVAQAQQAKRLHDVIVATDHTLIAQHLQKCHIPFVLTSPHHPSGTDRCAEVAQLLPQAEAIVNIQGDEPLIHPEQIDAVAEVLLRQPPCDLATLVRPFEPGADLQQPNTVKVVCSSHHTALYFSRSPIPFLRDHPDPATWAQHHTYYQHIGIYGYRRETLLQISKLPVSTLEQAERLEQLRWLQAGLTIGVAITHHASHGVDTPDDLRYIENTFFAPNGS